MLSFLNSGTIQLTSINYRYKNMATISQLEVKKLSINLKNYRTVPQYEYNFTVDHLNISSLPLDEIMLTTEGGKNIKDEIISVFGKDCELYGLLKVAENNLGRMLHLNKANQVEEMSNSEIII